MKEIDLQNRLEAYTPSDETSIFEKYLRVQEGDIVKVGVFFHNSSEEYRNTGVLHFRLTDSIVEDPNIHNISPSSYIGIKLLGKKTHDVVNIDCKDPYDIEILKIKKDF